MTHQEIISQMTLEEKFRFLTGVDMNHSFSIPRLGIEEMAFHDSPFGVKKLADSEHNNGFTKEAFAAVPNCEGGAEVPSTAFPNGCALGATFDEELLEEMGQALGEEYRAYGINDVMGPAVNIKRHPLCGRNFEYMSEDPYLSGNLGAAYVRGVQSMGVSACPKHYIANNQERGRFWVSSEMDERTMREIYLKPFEIIVKESKPWSMMCAYNRINGVYASEHKQLLSDILRDEWGFDGIIVSDWSAVKNRAVSLLASVEMCMPYQDDAYSQLEEAYESGLIDDVLIDEAVLRLLRFYDRTKTVYEHHKIDFEKHNETALKAAKKAMTLIKNENHRLPLDKNKLKRILVLGDCAQNPFYAGDGSSKVKNPPYMTRPLDEIKKLCGENIEVDYLGKEALDCYKTDIGVYESTVARHAVKADEVIIFIGQGYGESSETMDRNHMEIEPEQEHLIRTCARVGKKPVVVLNIGAAVTVKNWENCADAILVSWMAGQGMGRAAAETIFGINNPAGRLAETFPQKLYDVESVKNYPGNGYVACYDEKLMVGYRHFDTNRVTPSYEFGFGLSYSEFEYKNLKIDGLKLSFDLKNKSDTDGEEVVQVYVSAPEMSWVSHPEKELKAFRRVALKAGEKKRIEITLTEDDFRYYNTALHRWISETGAYTVRVGGSSRKLPLCCTIDRECELPLTTTQGMNF